MDWVDVIVAAISAITGGGLLKLGDFWISKDKKKFDQNAQWRAEYRTDLDTLKKDFTQLKVDFKEEQKSREEAEDKYERLQYDFGRFKLQMFKVLTDNDIDTSPYDWDF